MTISFEELDYQETPLGPVSLRRRMDPLLAETVYEVKLDDEFLMSSRFHASEVALAKLGLAALEGSDWDVVVGGLGLGYTAAEALENQAVKSLTVIELLKPVIDWHRRGLVPMEDRLATDSRCELVQADFFAWAMSGESEEGKPASEAPVDPVHAILLDVDHSPSHWLNPSNGAFYSVGGLRSLSEKLLPGGVFGLWSDDPPEERFVELLRQIFASAKAHVVSFPNPYLGGESSATIYVAQTGE